MCFLDSPLGRCELARTMVVLDQTQDECANEHACPPERSCPFAACFAQASGLFDTDIDTLPRGARGTETRSAGDTAAAVMPAATAMARRAAFLPTELYQLRA